MLGVARQSSTYLVALLLSLGSGGVGAGEQGRSVSARFNPIRDEVVRQKFLKKLSTLFSPNVVCCGGAPLESVVKQVCGFVDEKGYLLNSSRVVVKNELEKYVIIPPCPYWVFDTQISLPLDSTEEQFDSKMVGALGYPYKNKTKNLVQKKNPGLSVLKLAKSGQNINVPYVTRPVTFTVLPSIQLRASDALEMVEKEFPQAVIVDPLTGKSVNYDGSSEFGIVAPASQDQDQCSGKENYTSFDAKLLIEKIKENDREASLKKVKILVIDTGIERNVVKDYLSVVLNDIDYQNNQYGINARTRRGPPSPLPDYPLRFHGTSVSALVLGGLESPLLNDFVRSRVELEAVQVVERLENEFHKTEFSISGASLSTALSYARGSAQRLAPAVVNMSIEGRASDYPEVRFALTSTPAVIVAAAGNFGYKEWKAIETPFPISHKDNLKGRMLIVGAYDNTDSSKTPSAFSNVGSSWVDVLAPGCRIETVSSESKREGLSGTSFAAPQVAFGAVMLASMGFPPTLIKARVLGASRFDENLERYAFSSGRLDILRTVSLNSAFLRTRVNGKGELDQSGDFEIITTEGDPCEDADKSDDTALFAYLLSDRSRLVKVVGFSENGAEVKLRFYHTVGSDGAVGYKECRASNGSFVHSSEGGKSRWKDLIEFVPRYIWD